MGKRMFVLAAALAMALVPASRAAGQQFALGVQFGLAIDDSSYDSLPFEIKNGLGPTYGLRVGIRQGHFGAEVGYAHISRSLIPDADAPPDLQDTELTLNSLSFNALYYPFLASTLQPYLTGGYAYYRLNVVGYGEDRTSGFNLGGGLNLLLLPSVSVSLEARYHWVDFTLADAAFDARNWAATLGLSYHF